MKLIRIEKKLVNSAKKGERNIGTAERLFGAVDLGHVKTVLEVGCGVGMLTSYLAEKYQWHITGVDLDPEQIESARTRHGENEHLRFWEADATELPFGKDEFDMVLSFDVLHHIPRWDKAIAEMDRALKPEGVCILHDLAFSGLAARTLEGLFKNYGAFYTVGDFIHHLQRSNLEIVYAQTPKRVMIAEHFSVVARKG
jgi:ubiquinone/menaquinone biosynthesis C-methylase UbiE